MERLDKRLTFTPDRTHKIYSFIIQIEELKGQWKFGTHLSPQILGRLKKSTIVTSTGASTRIEGSRLSDEEVKKLLKGLKIQKLKTRDEQEVAGYAELLANIFDSFKDIMLSEGAIKHFHGELLKYSEKDKPHTHLVPKEMNELIQWTLSASDIKKIHPLMIIGNFIFEFLSIHPFQDGNGRTSRVLTNFLLLKNGYEYIQYVSHEKLVEDNKEKYYLALNKSQKSWKTDNEDITEWLIFFLEITLEQSKRAIQLLSSESIEHLLSEKQLEVWNYIQKNEIVTPRELQEQLKMPTPTVLQTLNKLLNMKKIKRLGEGRGVRYRRL